MIETNVGYKKKEFDDSVNFQSKESFIKSSGNSANKIGTMKARNKSINQNFINENELFKPKHESTNSLCLINSINEFESSPIHQENNVKRPNEGINENIKYYQKCLNK